MLKKHTARILVLDDEAFMLKLLSRMLGNLGFTAVTTFNNGQAALQHIDHADGLPDLILLDMKMPEMDGVEFVHELAERHYTGALILVSAQEERVLQTAEKMVQSHNIQLLGRLDKPVTLEAMAAMLKKWEAPARDDLKVYGADEVRAATANGELVNYYQPKVEVATRMVVGVETLVRWNHPKDGLVLPDRFIGVAEAHGLIDDLSVAVLASALAQAREWQKNGMSLQLAVNISMDNLESPGFADAVEQLAANAGVPPEQVMLEVTESRLRQEELRAPLETLTRLRMKHFRLSIDNFGTGHSTFSSLRDIPFDELKIDRSIVHGGCADSTLRAKYDTSLVTAKELHMASVTMGVEDRDDWNLLCRTGCDFAQGYFIARPMPASGLYGWNISWQARLRDEFSPIPEQGATLHEAY